MSYRLGMKETTQVRVWDFLDEVDLLCRWQPSGVPELDRRYTEALQHDARRMRTALRRIEKLSGMIDPEDPRNLATATALTRMVSGWRLWIVLLDAFQQRQARRRRKRTS